MESRSRLGRPRSVTWCGSSTSSRSSTRSASSPCSAIAGRSGSAISPRARWSSATGNASASTILPARPRRRPTPTPASSIWSTPGTATTAAPAGPSGAIERPLDPALRRLVVAYAARRELLPLQRRQALAGSAEAALSAALPDVVAADGPLAALDRLAEREGITPLRPVHRNASSAQTWGVTALIFCWMPLIAIPTGILSIVFGGDALKAIRAAPQKYQGEDKARTGRLLGIIGLSLTCIGLVIIILAIAFGNG